MWNGIGTERSEFCKKERNEERNGMRIWERNGTKNGTERVFWNGFHHCTQSLIIGITPLQNVTIVGDAHDTRSKRTFLKETHQNLRNSNKLPASLFDYYKLYLFSIRPLVGNHEDLLFAGGSSNRKRKLAGVLR